MAVYTVLEKQDIEGILADYPCSTLVDFKGITAGVENTNYFLYTQEARYILTVFEKRVNHEEIPYFIDAMEHLQSKGIVCPSVLSQKNGEKITYVQGKPAIIITFLEGTGLETVPNRAQARQLGTLVAQCHQGVADFPLHRENALTVPDWRALFTEIEAQVPDETRQFVTDELSYLEQNWASLDIPKGAVHTDIFPDNVFFKGDTLTGIIDFYFMCTDFLLYDIAIVCNAWFFDATHTTLDKACMDAFLQGYEAIRPLTQDERQSFTLVARGACMRFYITRLYDEIHTPSGAQVTVKDATEYAKKLAFYQTLQGDIV